MNREHRVKECTGSDRRLSFKQKTWTIRSTHRLLINRKIKTIDVTVSLPLKSLLRNVYPLFISSTLCVLAGHQTGWQAGEKNEN